MSLARRHDPACRGRSTPSAPTTSTCPYPSTPFTNRTEGNKFRDWVNDAYRSIAKIIDGGTGKKDGLDRSGAYNNCYIRQAYHYKVGGRTLGNIWKAVSETDVTPSTTDDKEDDWEQFVQRLRDQGYKITLGKSNSGAHDWAKIRLTSTNPQMQSYYYQVAYASTGTWALAMSKSETTGYNTIAQGTFNLGELKSGTKIKVTSGSEKDGDSLKGYGVTANNSIIYPIQMVVYKYWSSYGMTKTMAQTLKSISF